ncbi:MAG TPA: hypothetical protein VL356_07795 [Acidocella sp.]|nr:hypothetical protein [Acidocella sp.]
MNEMLFFAVCVGMWRIRSATARSKLNEPSFEFLLADGAGSDIDHSSRLRDIQTSAVGPEKRHHDRERDPLLPIDESMSLGDAHAIKVQPTVLPSRNTYMRRGSSGDQVRRGCQLAAAENREAVEATYTRTEPARVSTAIFISWPGG